MPPNRMEGFFKFDTSKNEFVETHLVHLDQKGLRGLSWIALAGAAYLECAVAVSATPALIMAGLGLRAGMTWKRCEHTCRPRS